MNAKTIGIIFAVAAAALLAAGFSSCASAPERDVGWTGTEAGNDGIWTLSAVEDGAAVFSTNRLEQATVFGEAFPSGDGSWVFHIDGIRWFESRTHGWTEASFAAYGSLHLVPNGGSWRAEVLETPVIDGVAEARLMYRGTGYYGDRAADIVRRRWLRTLSAAEYIRSLPEARGGGFGEPGRSRRRSASETFTENVGSRLFPEVYGSRKGRRKGSDHWTWAEGIWWDTSHTEEVFPPELRDVRNSATLLRDFEESPGLLYLAYLWPWLWDSAVPQSDIELRSEQ